MCKFVFFILQVLNFLNRVNLIEWIIFLLELNVNRNKYSVLYLNVMQWSINMIFYICIIIANFSKFENIARFSSNNSRIEGFGSNLSVSFYHKFQNSIDKEKYHISPISLNNTNIIYINKTHIILTNPHYKMSRVNELRNRIFLKPRMRHAKRPFWIIKQVFLAHIALLTTECKGIRVGPCPTNKIAPYSRPEGRTLGFLLGLRPGGTPGNPSSDCGPVSNPDDNPNLVTIDGTNQEVDYDPVNSEEDAGTEILTCENWW